MLDPARLWKMLSEFMLSDPGDLAFTVEEHGP